jgi:hypothetical protein
VRRGFAVLALAAALAVGCNRAPEIPVDPSAIPGSPLVLTFDGRGNPPVLLRINGVDVAHLACTEGGTRAFAPGADGVPLLPWDLKVIRERDGTVLISEHVTSMPKWLLLFADGTGGIGSLPALGPMPPTCAPG